MNVCLNKMNGMNFMRFIYVLFFSIILKSKCPFFLLQDMAALKKVINNKIIHAMLKRH